MLIYAVACEGQFFVWEGHERGDGSIVVRRLELWGYRDLEGMVWSGLVWGLFTSANNGREIAIRSRGWDRRWLPESRPLYYYHYYAWRGGCVEKLGVVRVAWAVICIRSRVFGVFLTRPLSMLIALDWSEAFSVHS